MSEVRVGSSKSELLFCPFCGGEAEPHEVVFPYHYWDVWCDGECFDHFCEKPTEAEAIAAWNTRAERTCHNTWDAELTGRLRFQCSECGGVSLEITPRFCPCCGARVIA